ADLVQDVEERLWIKLFHIDHLLHIPFARSNQDRGCNRWNASGIGNTLRAHFVVSVLVVGNVIDEDFLLLAVLSALDKIADAGLAGIIRRQRRWIGQNGLDLLERHDFQTFSGLDWLLGQE